MNQESITSTRISNLPPYALSGVASRVHALRMDGCDVIDCSQLNPALPPAANSFSAGFFFDLGTFI